MERLDFQLFFHVITVVIDAFLHVLWHFLYRLVLELYCHIANRTLTDFRDPFTQIANCHMPIFKHFLFLLHLCNCFGLNQRPTRMLFIMDVYTSVHEFSDPLLHVCDVHTLRPVDFA